MADMISIMNAIRTEAGSEYAARVPQATRDNISAIGNAILEMGNPGVETFLNLLINRIGMTIIRSRIIKNPLSVLKRGGTALGKFTQEIGTNPAKAQKYSMANGENLLKTNKADSKVLYHERNREDQYKVTITKALLQQAFVSWVALSKFMNDQINSLYSGDELDQFILTKNLMADAVLTGKCKSVEVDYEAAGGRTELVKEMAKASSLFQFPSDLWNSYADMQKKADPAWAGTPYTTWCPKNKQVLIIRSDVQTDVNIDVLAAAFNIDKVTLLANRYETDSFGAASDVLALLADESAENAGANSADTAYK
jgi:hypothetical protein